MPLEIIFFLIIQSNQTCYDLRLTMKQLVTLLNFSNRIATNITKLLPNQIYIKYKQTNSFYLPKIPTTAIKIQVLAKTSRLCNDGPSL